MRNRGYFILVLTEICLLGTTGCRQMQSTFTPDIKVEPGQSKLDRMTDKGIVQKQPPAQQAAPLAENVKIVTGEPAVQSNSEEMKHPDSKNDTGAVAVKYEV